MSSAGLQMSPAEAAIFRKRIERGISDGTGKSNSAVHLAARSQFVSYLSSVETGLSVRKAQPIRAWWVLNLCAAETPGTGPFGAALDIRQAS